MSKEKKNEKTENTSEGEKVGLGSVSIRLDPANAQYATMKTNEGWFQASGAPRLPELHKDVRLNLSLAVKSGCALLGISGGIRVMKNAYGEGGVFFVERRSAQNGAELYLFTKESKEKLEKAGLVVTREQKGFYVKPRTKDGELVFKTLFKKFTTNHGPMKWETHPWPGYEIDTSKAKKKSSGEKKEIKVKKEDKSEKKVEKSEKKEDEKVTVMPKRVVTKVEGKKKENQDLAATG